MLRGKHILLGVTGSIAAYKAAVLVRTLVKEGAEVKVVMTEMAKQFITPLTMATLSKSPVLVEFYNPENGDWNSHISLGMWADAYLIAPASANTIAKMATGVADNLLLTTYLSARCPVVVAPAMDVDMFLHVATQQNIETLVKRGVKIIDPNSGELASGLEGKGRMAEPDEIVSSLTEMFSEDGNMKGIKVLVNAGPTRESIDPVRYISNHSTGKMGYAIAAEFANRGAEVTLVSGPVESQKVHPAVKVINVVTAAEMFDVTTAEYQKGADVTVLCAAVADFTPSRQEQNKVKRGSLNWSLELEPTRDIAAAIGKEKKEGSLIAGFALETDHEHSNALSKLERKGLDMIILNSLNDKGAGFGTDTNKISIIARGGETVHYPLKSKEQVAGDIADYIENLLICSKA
ncbi:MAG: bifunctional phosphopantothenoylcysteine decarboxylase/phosphopantothenate--cysteine ligase CoaBC [Bacteroidetes bacterium HGW-Bacteroidetes-14]|jgi:phosphopantothenoylcysteine decarboxylase/phosphopantothenate--cysteine ligase|nr:MAG: bifunctional phosphopantothenoylcysteine decarboxylase/phosphopantothenate--cysteine ligase CoaBC [Bacteroidetes bacterium HGW-Bacteroidetes-14]